MNAANMEARATVIEVVAHLEGVAIMGQIKGQQETALKLAKRLLAVLPIVDAAAPAAESNTREPTEPHVDAPTTVWFVYYRAMITYQANELRRLRRIENAALRVASSRRNQVVTDQGPLDVLDAALEACS